MVPLAVWSVGRDPSHYAQLVLLLICTLALGTASLALSVTHDEGAWQVARFEDGGDARLDFDPTVYQPLTTLPGVTSSTPLLKVTTTEGQGEVSNTLFGIDPGADLPADLRTAAASLAQTDSPPLPGIALPDDAAQVTLQVYATLSDDGRTIQTRPALDLQDALGVTQTVPMTAAAELLSGAFQLYHADLPPGAHLPYRIVGVRLLSRIDGQGNFSGSIYIDDLDLIDAAGSATTLEDFEQVAAPEWTAANQTTALFSTITSAHAASGSRSLRIDYSIAQRGDIFSDAVLIVNRAAGAFNPIPVVISQAFAANPVLVGERSHRLSVGDEGTLRLKLPQLSLDLRFRVVGIVSDIPSTKPRDHVLIARLDALLPFLNRIATPEDFYGVNQVWLSLSQREPGADLKSAAATTPGLIGASYAWDLYNELRREPLPNAITGMLFAGFWVSLGLGLLDFGFYLAMTARRRATSFAVLRAMGWNAGKVWGLLTVEQATLVTPALIVGVAVGVGLAYVLLPFLALLGGASLRFPAAEIGGLLLALVIGFAILLGATAVALQRMSLNQVLRQE